jgi:hypothetical protein
MAMLLPRYLPYKILEENPANEDVQASAPIVQNADHGGTTDDKHSGIFQRWQFIGGIASPTR